MSDFEDLVLAEFDKKIFTSLFQKRLGIFLGNNVYFDENVKFNGKEYDIILSGEIRLYNGVPLLKPLNIEIEHPKLKINKVLDKYNPDFLLSFITDRGSCSAPLTSELVYSITNFVNTSMDNSPKATSLDTLLVNPNSNYLIESIGEHNISVLNNINNFSKFGEDLKESVLFFLGDYLINNYDSSNKLKLFFEPNNERISRCFFDTSFENVFFVNNYFIRELVNHNILKSVLENYLRHNGYSKNLVSKIVSKKVNILSLPNQEISDYLSSTEVSNVFVINNKKENVRHNNSIVETILIN